MRDNISIKRHIYQCNKMTSPEIEKKYVVSDVEQKFQGNSIGKRIIFFPKNGLGIIIHLYTK